MELVDGADLRASLRKSPHHKLSLSAALYLLAEVLRGLHSVHNAVDAGGLPRRIVHRDVSPANVLNSNELAVSKLGDFGIAHARSRLTLTLNGALKGKLKYMAPEQLTPGARIDHRADLYAVGVMLCEILLGDVVCEPRRITLVRRQRSPGRRASPSGCRTTWRRRSPSARWRKIRRAAFPTRRSSGAQWWRSFCGGSPATATRSWRASWRGSIDGFLKRDAHAHLRSRSSCTHRPGPRDLAAARRRARSDGHRAAAQVESPHPRRLGRGRRARRGVAALAVAALLTAGASSAARPPSFAALDPANAVRALDPAPVSTGILAVDGPPGASVMIGSTLYPAGRLELPPGEYEVALRKRARGRAVTRRVTIAAGAVTPIKL